MARRYATPLAFKAALEQRLRDECATTGADLNRSRQLLLFDRFLARLFRVFGSSITLKGGFVIELRLERARTTKDIDLRVVGNPDDALPRLQEAGRMDLGDYLAFEISPDPKHPEIDAEGLTHPGLRYRARTQLAGRVYGSQFGVDVAFAEPLFGQPEELCGSGFLEFAGIEAATFRVYPLETHIAEKLHAFTLPRQRTNSRVKDLPDLALLASARAIGARELRSALDTTFGHRATHPLPTALPQPPASWTHVYDRMAANDGLPWPDLQSVTRAVQQFLDPVLAGEHGSWSPKIWKWTASS